MINQNYQFDQKSNNDNIAYTKLYKKYVNDLYSYGTSLGFASNKCMDAIHDIFCKLFVNNRELDNVNNVKYYLFRSLKNRLLDIHKQDSRLVNDNLTNSNFFVEVSVVDVMISTEEKRQLKKRVDELMSTLTSNQREAIYLRYMQEMEYDEIAQLLNITSESVRKLVYRGISKLRTQSDLDIVIILLIGFSKL